MFDGSAPLALTTPAGLSGSVPAALIVPFGLLLLLIAVIPLLPHSIKQYWDKYYAHVAIGLGMVVGIFCLGCVPGGEQVVWAHRLRLRLIHLPDRFVVRSGW